MMQTEAERMRNLLMEAVTTLCRSGMRFEEALKVEGLLAITIDHSDIVVVNINKSFENQTAATKEIKEADQAGSHDVSGDDIDSADGSPSSSPRKRRWQRKKRSSSVASGGSDVELSNQSTKTVSKRLRRDIGESEGDSGEIDESLLDAGQPGDSSHSNRVTGCHGDDPAHAIKIELDSDPEYEDKEQLATELFGSGTDPSLMPFTVDQSSSSSMFDPMPVSMFSSSSFPGTSAMNLPATSAAHFQESMQPAFVSPQEGSAKVSRGQVTNQEQHIPTCPTCTCCEVQSEHRKRSYLIYQRHLNKNRPEILATLPELPPMRFRGYKVPVDHVSKCDCCEKVQKRKESKANWNKKTKAAKVSK